MRLRPYVALAVCVLLGACSSPLGQSPSPTSVPPTTAAAPPTTAAAPATEGPEFIGAPDQPTTAPDQPTAEPPQPTAQAAKPAYKSVDCRFQVPEGYEVECGDLTVPQDRSKDDGETVKIHAAVFKSQSNQPLPDPVVYLEGGPGGHSLDAIPFSFEDRFAPFLEQRDFIMFDQRGIGYSEPALDCAEIVDLAYETLDQDLSADESNKLYGEATTKCRERLAGEGIDLAAYTSAANAADLNDLRLALGYDEWNLYGISYGTRLALTEMRDFPEGIRSVILNSTVPLQVNINVDIPANADRAFEMLFAGCAADEACSQAFPDLKQTFYDLVDRLNQEPVTGKANDPFTGEEHTVLLNGDAIINTVFQSLYITDVIPSLPKAIVAANQGRDYSLLTRLAVIFAAQTKFISYGMYYSVQCGEEVSFISREELLAADEAFPEQHNLFDGGPTYEVCQSWGAKQADAVENEPVRSDLPTLVLGGEYDPITPPSYGKLAAGTLSESFFFEFPGLGHGVSLDHDCSRGITMAFVDDPTTAPDAACIKEMQGPAFEVPGGAITLEPFESEQFGIKGVAPRGWEEIAPGVYAQSSSAQIAIVQHALPGSRDDALAFWSERMGVSGTPESAGTRKTDQLEWTLYEISAQGQLIDLAVAEQDGKAFVVMLVSDGMEREALYAKLFLPAIDAFTPTS